MCAAPRFVPTLTEVVRPSLAEAEPRATVPVPAEPTPALIAPGDSLPFARSGPGSGPRSLVTPPVRGPDPTRGGDPEALAAWIEAEVSDTLRRNLHDLIATALVEQIDVVAARLREDIEPMVRRAVLEAVANEAASRLPD